MRSWKTFARQRVLINLKTGTAISGVLFEQRGSVLVLKAARILEQGKEPVALDGDVLIETPNIDFAQVITATEA